MPNLGYSREPIFLIVGSNGTSLVEEHLTYLGWKRGNEKTGDNFKLKWVECRYSIDYHTFKSGEQMVNRIPNTSLLTNKIGLLTSLQSYQRVCWGMANGPKMKLDEFLPETYRLDDPKERSAFYDSYRTGDIWICKPSCMNQGKGIYLIRDLTDLAKHIQEREERFRAHKRTVGRIIQRYIHNPLLLDGRKFDIRAFMLIASTSPFLVLYQKGYVRLSMVKYNVESDNLVAHLTNQYIQKKDPKYQKQMQESIWTMDRFNEYVNENFQQVKGIEKDWVYRTLTRRIKQIMKHCFKATKHKLQSRVGYFDLYGLDLMVDENMKVWLIEINANPSLATNCKPLKSVIPCLVKETLNVAIECFEKARKGQNNLTPLRCQGNFHILYNGSARYQLNHPVTQKSVNLIPNLAELVQTVKVSPSVRPVRKSRSLSSNKDEKESRTRPSTKKLEKKYVSPCQSLIGHYFYQQRSAYSYCSETGESSSEPCEPIILKLTHTSLHNT